MSTTQFNVRLEEDDKQAGDEAFASIDYTPSQVVQAVWAYAARNRRNKKALRKLASLLDGQTAETSSEQEDRLKWHAAAPKMYKDMLKEMGIKETPAPLGLTDEELLYQAYVDKAAERGMPV